MILVSNSTHISTSALYDPNYIAHHGIKGQKWGERRFQNEDGSLTSAGKTRYGVGEGIARRALAGVYSINEKAYNKLGNKTLASMNRAAKERQLALAKKADPNRDKRVEARKQRIKSTATKAYEHEKERGHDLGKHAIARAGLGYALSVPLNSIAGVGLGTAAGLYTKNEKIGAIVTVGAVTAFNSASAIKAGRNAIDRAIYLGDKAYKKRQSKKNG